MAVSIADMKRINKEKGYYYFSPDTIRFMGAKIITAPNRFGIFVDSYDNFYRTRKLFKVCIFSEISGRIYDIEPAAIAETYEHFPTKADALKFREKLTAAFADACKCYREKAVLTAIDDIQEEGLNSGIFTIRSGEKAIEINTNDFSRFICG